ncbi:LacI family transcriptional regulator [Capsulimonas corticalis]|uniref:LacI family transcriptional regulator n=1 Tax=Capsulimonas corticalis TaxID=2219043 RepID=A0A402D1G1_9BACT|nr:LacI family DNA-binding transcriptional regulator [Capsulimonas corticalis]BDI31618.1 LacI family transcriptional regulator [Capsulimonas corticalis]
MSSINEVARQAGVSPATVSRTFRTPELLSHQTRRRVLHAAAELNYQPRQRVVKADAEPMGAETAESLGFLFFASDQDGTHVNDFYSPVMMGAQAEAGRLGRHLILRTTSRFEAPPEMPKMFREQSVAGMLLVGAALPDILAAYDSHLPPSVLVDNRDTSGRHDCILSDGFGGMLAATQHLLDLGHRRIAFIQDEPTAPSFRDRQRGYLCALWEAGLIPNPEWIVSTERRANLEPYLAPLMAEANPPTAIVAANDMNAFAVLAACRTLGLSVPKDLSVVGFDDTTFSIHSYPALTTVRVNKGQMGRLAVRQLIARIEEAREGATPLPSANFVVPVSLVERESCAPPRN